ncbi:hypothetical protein OsI_33497 [Oryza sativa Indica Group]|uniref:Uncharacterized protein n=1 Tax=Oryza sativa subsp. indica TaxID=39946 RepID=B8BGQ5_ORYSI|nr:hypothetical protein OsI_33497 [Oryza sativa Indica Group]
MLQGVNPKYENLRTILPLQRPLPSFIEARSQLILAEINKSSNRSTNSSTALLASTGSGNRNGTGGKNLAHATGYSNPNQSQAGSATLKSAATRAAATNRNRRRRGNGDQGGNQGGGSQPAQGAGGQGNQPRITSAWPTPQHPWARTIQMWLGAACPGQFGLTA